jgi:hypothetical protein
MRRIFRPLDAFGFTDEEREALAKAKLLTPEQLWEKAAETPADPLAELSTATTLTPDRLKMALAKAGKAEVWPARGNWIARHWLDVAVLAGVVLVEALARQDPPRRDVPRAQLLTSVPAFHVLRDTDVTDTTTVPPRGAVRRDVLPGQLTLRPMKAGEPVTAADLGPRLAPDALAGRAVLSLSTLPARAAAAPQAGSRVGVVLSPRAPGTGGGAVLRDVLVLSTAQTDSTLRVVVAVPEADLSTAAALLGSSDVHLVTSPSAP